MAGIKVWSSRETASEVPETQAEGSCDAVLYNAPEALGAKACYWIAAGSWKTQGV